MGISKHETIGFAPRLALGHRIKALTYQQQKISITMAQAGTPFPLDLAALSEIVNNYKARPAVEFAAANWPLVIAIVIMYLMAIQIGTRFMAKASKPFDLKYPLAAWNLFLSVFSFLGMYHTVRTQVSMIALKQVPELTSYVLTIFRFPAWCL